MTLHEYLLFIILPVLAISVLFIAARFLVGPTIADRIVALDLLVTTGIGVITVYSVVTDQATLLDVGMILALIAFLSTVAFSYYLKKRNKK